MCLYSLPPGGIVPEQWPSQSDQPDSQLGNRESIDYLVYQQNGQMQAITADPGLALTTKEASWAPSSTDRSPQGPHSGRSPAPGRAEAAETWERGALATFLMSRSRRFVLDDLSL